jgi:hypothetical protein
MLKPGRLPRCPCPRCRNLARLTLARFHAVHRRTSILGFGRGAGIVRDLHLLVSRLEIAQPRADQGGCPKQRYADSSASTVTLGRNRCDDALDGRALTLLILMVSIATVSRANQARPVLTISSEHPTLSFERCRYSAGAFFRCLRFSGRLAWQHTLRRSVHDG